jgi:hypothetical protein
MSCAGRQRAESDNAPPEQTTTLGEYTRGTTSALQNEIPLV